MSSAAAPDASPTKATRQCDVLRKELSSLVSMAAGEVAGVEQVLDVEGRAEARSSILAQYEQSMLDTPWTVALMSAEWEQLQGMVAGNLLRDCSPPPAIVVLMHHRRRCRARLTDVIGRCRENRG